MADHVSIDIDDVRVITRFDGLSADIHDALFAKVSVLRLMLEAKIKSKLSNDVLNVRTGALRRSIFSETEDRAADGVYGMAASSGDVKYAAIHEFGYVGTEHVRAHVRSITSVFGHALKDPVLAQVKPFDRQMNMPEKSFLRSSLAEMSDQIVAELQAAVAGVVAR